MEPSCPKSVFPVFCDTHYGARFATAPAPVVFRKLKFAERCATEVPASLGEPMLLLTLVLAGSKGIGYSWT